MKNGDQLFHLAPERRLWLAYAGLLGLLAWFCFGDLRHHLIETHDGEHFRDNARISEDWTYFFSPDKEQASGRLLYEFVSFLFYLIWGADPGKYHLLAVAGHVAVSLLLAVCFRATGCNIELALVAGLVFLVNVAHFRAIHWLSGLNYVMGLGCALLALLSFARSADGQRRRWLAICYASLAFGALSHLAGLMAWPFCFYWAWSRGRDLRRALRDLLPFALPLVPVLVLIARSTSEETSTAETLHAYPSASVFDLVTSTLRSGLWLCSRLLTTAHWLPPRADARQDWELALGAAMTGALVYWIWRRRDPVAVWSAWTIALLVPFALIAEKLLLNLPFGPSRYLYFASAGSSLLLAWGLQRIGLGLGAWGRPFLALGLSGLMAVSYVGLQRAEGLTFYASARSYLVRGEEDTALNLLEKALAAGQDAVPRAEFPDHPPPGALRDGGAIVGSAGKRGNPRRPHASHPGGRRPGRTGGQGLLQRRARLRTARRYAPSGAGLPTLARVYTRPARGDGISGRCAVEARTPRRGYSHVPAPGPLASHRPRRAVQRGADPPPPGSPRTRGGILPPRVGDQGQRRDAAALGGEHRCRAIKKGRPFSGRPFFCLLHDGIKADAYCPSSNDRPRGRRPYPR